MSFFKFFPAEILKENITRLKDSSAIYHPYFYRFLPHPYNAEFKESYLSNVKRNLIIFQTIQKLLTSISKWNVTPIFFKGIYLIEDVYHDPGIRALKDIDIIVSEHQFDDFFHNFLKLDGVYRVSSTLQGDFARETVFLKSRFPIYFDIHKFIINPKALHVNHQLLFENLNSKKFGQKNVIHFFSAIDNFIVLLVHYFFAEPRKMFYIRNLIDFYFLLKKILENNTIYDILKRANRLGVEKIVKSGIKLLFHEFRVQWNGHLNSVEFLYRYLKFSEKERGVDLFKHFILFLYSNDPFRYANFKIKNKVNSILTRFLPGKRG